MKKDRFIQTVLLRRRFTVMSYLMIITKTIDQLNKVRKSHIENKKVGKFINDAVIYDIT